MRLLPAPAPLGRIVHDNLIGPGPLTWQIPDPMLAVRMMFCYAIQEEQPTHVMAAFMAHVKQFYNLGRARGSPWSIAIDPLTAHENGNSRLLALRFFDVAFSTSPLLQGKPAAAWSGDPRSLEINAGAPGSEGGADLRTAWLINEQLAYSWQEYARAGTICTVQAPPAPAWMTATKIAGGTVLEWNAVPGIESPLREFRIYGDRQLLTVRGAQAADDGLLPLQRWNFYDQPEDSVDRTMRVTWRGATHRNFTITSVNGAGLESEATAARETPRTAKDPDEEIHYVDE